MDEVTFDEAQQAKVNTLVGEARVKARELAQAEFDKKATAAQTKANEETERANLAADKKWEQIIAQGDAKVKELELLGPQVAAYEELIAGMLKDKVKALGDGAKQAVEGLPGNPTALERLNWLNKNEETFGAESDKKTPGTVLGKKKTKAAPASVRGHADSVLGPGKKFRP